MGPYASPGIVHSALQASGARHTYLELPGEHLSAIIMAPFLRGSEQSTDLLPNNIPTLPPLHKSNNLA
jgi:hypothetical protein